MFKNLKLSKKLILAFMSLAVVTLILGTVGYYAAFKGDLAIKQIGSIELPSTQYVLEMQVELERVVGGVRTLMNPDNAFEARQQQYDGIAAARKKYGEYKEQYEVLPHFPEEEQAWNEFLQILPEWVNANNEILDLHHKLDEIHIYNPDALEAELHLFLNDHHATEAKVANLLIFNKMFEGGDNPKLCNFGKWLANFQNPNPRLRNFVDNIHKTHDCIHENVGKIRTTVQAGNREEANKLFLEVLQPALYDIYKSFDQVSAESEQAQHLYRGITELTMGRTCELQKQAFKQLDKVVELNLKGANQDVVKASAQATFLKALSLITTVIGVALAVTMGLLITRAITKPINQIIASLTEGSEQVSSAAGQVSAASQSLAEGATEQAAGLEETSSSLEEMSSMTKQNADNAQQTNILASKAQAAAEGGSEAMKRMNKAINDIHESSDKTAKIIKVIDEIAFQTNLLALNAAVEAARAGEAGKGFAVVAEEVRNLAMRSAEAAKETSNMIEESVKKAENGVDISNEVNASLDDIVSAITKTTNLVSEISLACQEQAQGIEQVNTAVSQMDKVTQQNAANAEESASASEELSAQAEQMQMIINDLVTLVEGASASNHNILKKSLKHKRYKDKSSPQVGLVDHAYHQIAQGKSMGIDSKNIPMKSKAEKVIPMDNDFSDFCR